MVLLNEFDIVVYAYAKILILKQITTDEKESR